MKNPQHRSVEAKAPEPSNSAAKQPQARCVLHFLNPKPLNPKPLNSKPLNPKPLNPKPLISRSLNPKPLNPKPSPAPPPESLNP